MCNIYNGIYSIWIIYIDFNKVNEFAKKAKDTDGFVFGSPVHYAAASGALTSFLDRKYWISFINYLIKKNNIGTLLKNVSLKKYTSYKIENHIKSKVY